jgi:hypothetical protein
MERWAAHGPGARNRMRPAFALRALCNFRPRSLAPPRSVHASAWGDCLFRRGSGTRMLVRPTSPVPVRQQVPVSRPATGEASRNAPDPGVSPRAIPLDRPPPPLQCLDPQPLSCDGDGQRVAHRCTGSGRTVRETVGVLKGLGNWRAAIIAEGASSALLLPLREKEPPEKGARERRMRVGTIAIPQRRRGRGQARGRGRPSRDWRPRSGRTSTGGATA